MTAPASGGSRPAVPPPAPPPLRAASDAVFLDIDGTLARLELNPEDVVAEPARTESLNALAQALDGAVALVSGRSLADIDRISGAPALAAAGVHGLEQRFADGRVERAEPHPALREAAAALCAAAGGREGLLVEDKGLGVTLHYRRAPDFEAQAVALAEHLAYTHGLVFQRGDMIVELRTPGRDKGRALQGFMAVAPFAGRRPVFVGDDLTDEDGFRAAQGLGGYGVLVGERGGSVADYRLADPPAVLAWLASAARS